jgi:hypothetical protein
MRSAMTGGTEIKATITTTLLLVVLLLSPTLEAQSRSCQREGGFATLDDKLRWLQGEEICDAAPRPGTYELTSLFGVFVDVLALDELEIEVSGAEVELLNGVHMEGMLGSTVAGGLSFGVGGRLLRCIRLPEVSLTLGGARIDGGWFELSDQRRGVSMRPTSAFIARFEVALGFEIPIPYLRPYLLGRAAGALYVFGADVRDERLGALGREYASGGGWDLGTEAGLSIPVSNGLAINIGWRATWYGATGHGVSITLTGSRGE